MDTGGKVATGILVPLGVIGLGAAGYWVYQMNKQFKAERARRSGVEREKVMKGRQGQIAYLSSLGRRRTDYSEDEWEDMGYPMPKDGGRKRRTHRRRR